MSVNDKIALVTVNTNKDEESDQNNSSVVLWKDSNFYLMSQCTALDAKCSSMLNSVTQSLESFTLSKTALYWKQENEVKNRFYVTLRKYVSCWFGFPLDFFSLFKY